MAALTPAQLELASSLAQDELPSKLKCANCNKLAVNAFRLPCCETAICENCQSTLPSSCPVCEHSPVSGDDCTVYKSLRTTIRVFLKTEEKKREAAKPKVNDSPPLTPVEPTPTPAPAVAKLPVESTLDENATSAPIADSEGQAEQPSASGEPLPSTETHLSSEDEPHRDDESLPQPTDQDANNAEDEAVVPQAPSAGDQQDEPTNGDEVDGQDSSKQNDEDYEEESGDYPNGAGFDGASMNPMQMQMMMMQNSMNPSFGGFPMMGMGMGMDPMAMQNVMMNGGFGAQGMNMNGMNMNMGMNGFNGGSNDWNDQQSWQDNFNPNATGMANGDFGNFNSGFQGGYNAGNYGQFNGQGNYQYRGRGGRGRGWRGGYSRGGYNQGYQRHYGQQQMWSQDIAQHPSNNFMSQDGAGGGEDGAQKPGSTDEFGRTVPADGEQDAAGQDPHGAEGTDDASGENHGETGVANGDVSADSYSRPQGFSYGAGVPAAPNAPLNAPTGPKAMRQGLPNTSTLHLRARGFIQDHRPAITNSPVVESPIQDGMPQSRSSSRHSQHTRDKTERPSEQDREDYGNDRDEKRSRANDRDYDPSHSRSRSRSHSQSRDKDHKDSRRHRRHQSETITEGDRDDESRRHRHKSRRSTRDDDYKSRPKDDRYDERSRSGSPERDREHKRSGHRSHRDKERERDRDSDREYLATDLAAKDFNPPSGPRGSSSSIAGKGSGSAEFSIKGASSKPKSSSHRRDSEMSNSRRGSHASTAAPKGAPAAIGKDPHTLEREARDRERLLKEAQRMAGLAGLAGMKRSRDGGDDRGGRRKNRRGESTSESDEQRMRRLEAEREGDRWD
ncbi:hypothetical protein E8E14_013948 [Neopestalotiopsis sp. 37M]|nr:hypothetical protein E8E14_013948 [Neopestalotiopsis sp. 37M]